jgi:diguanylate cyclase (GGDEF)-like protein
LTRRAFVERVGERAARARAELTPFGVCIIDLDHLKKINLSHGLTRGDAVLRGVAERLVRTSNPGDADRAATVIARYDGDTFAALLETGTAPALVRIAERLRLAAGGGVTRVSASAGAAIARLGEPPDEVLLRAEQALYLAKQLGRDRLELSPSPASRRGPAKVVSLQHSA